MEVILKSEVHPTISHTIRTNGLMEVILKSEVHPTDGWLSSADRPMEVILKSEVHPTCHHSTCDSMRWKSS